jgi:hypothetical protein
MPSGHGRRITLEHDQCCWAQLIIQVVVDENDGAAPLVIGRRAMRRLASISVRAARESDRFEDFPGGRKYITSRSTVGER